MTDIYFEISKLSDKFKEMCYGLTTDKNEVDELVQELMLYFLQMNPDVLKNIWEKDGKKGILNYGAVALKRAYTSPRSPYFYKYKKYYTHIDRFSYNTNKTISDDRLFFNNYNNKNIINIEDKKEQGTWEKLNKIDQALNKFNWYDRKIFELYYYESNTLDSLSEKTKIGRNSLFSTIEKVRTLLKKELNEEN